MDLLRTRVLEHRDDLPRRVAPHDRVVDDDHALAGHDLGQRVELHPQPVLAQLLAGLDEGTRHVAVLDQAVVLGQPRGAREAVRRRVARVRHRDHEVRLDRRLRARGSRPSARAPPAAPGSPAACPAARSRCARTRTCALRSPGEHRLHLEPPLAQRHHLAGLDLADHLRADDVEGAALRGDDEALGMPVGRLHLPQRQRPHPVRVAECDHGVLGHHHGRVGALQARHHLGHRVLDPGIALARPLREQRGDDLRVRGAAQLDPLLVELVLELDGVGQVAVVRQRQLAPVVAPDGLRVLPRPAARGRVAHVADRHVPGERPQLLLVEDL